MLRTLHDNWTLRAVSGPVPAEVAAAGPIPATVPGCVHTDLLAAGLIPDPYLDDNERRLAWIGLTDWRYETTFQWTPDGDEHTELVFDGLDTVAWVELNGHGLASTHNMHRSYVFEVADLLRDGVNTLSVTFASAVRYADRASLDLGARPHVNHHPYNAIRKMACNFGWDWGPDLVTAGLWRPVALRSWSTARLTAVRPVTTVDGSRGIVDVYVDLMRARGLVEVTASVGGVTEVVTTSQASFVVRIVVEDVALWWPRGHGAQPLYDIDVTVRRDSADEPLDSWHGRIGFRTARLETTQDAQGLGVRLVVNDRPVFVRGANWIPNDAFVHRVDQAHYAERLAQAEEAGINLVRVWGGGIYEADDFYAECDERGILVWQDFPFACAAYAEEEPLRSEILTEARENVTRLMPHPSLVIWNGGNETIWGFFDWGWEPALEGRPWGLGYYLDALPAIVSELDPGRPYVASSPWSWSIDRHPNTETHGTMHLWDVWNHRDYTAYREHRPRFAAEFGWQGPPAWSTLRRSISDDPLTPESPGMLAHQKASDGHTKLTLGLVGHLPVPGEMDAWHWAMSLNQARAVQLGVEYFRSLSPYCMGSVLWQLNDCWPVVSWSVVDGDGRRKPAFYALRHAHADRLLTVQPAEGGLQAVLVNDSEGPWAGGLELSRCTYEGKVLATSTTDVRVGPFSTLAVPVPEDVAAAGTPAGELLLATLGGERGLWFYVEDRDSQLPPPAYQAWATRDEDGYRVTLTAEALLRDAALLVDKLDPDAVVNDMLTTLLPGETVTWHVRSSVELDPDAWLAPTILRTANQLLHR